MTAENEFCEKQMFTIFLFSEIICTNKYHFYDFWSLKSPEVKKLYLDYKRTMTYKRAPLTFQLVIWFSALTSLQKPFLLAWSM